jgi:hypothetical protein
MAQRSDETSLHQIFAGRLFWFASNLIYFDGAAR